MEHFRALKNDNNAYINFFPVLTLWSRAGSYFPAYDNTITGWAYRNHAAKCLPAFLLKLERVCTAHRSELSRQLLSTPSLFSLRLCHVHFCSALTCICREKLPGFRRRLFGISQNIQSHIITRIWIQLAISRSRWRNRDDAADVLLRNFFATALLFQKNCLGRTCSREETWYLVKKGRPKKQAGFENFLNRLAQVMNKIFTFEDFWKFVKSWVKLSGNCISCSI